MKPQITMQQNTNHIHNPLMIQHQNYSHGHTQCNNNVTRSNWLPVSHSMAEMQSICNCGDQTESRSICRDDMDSYIKFQFEKLRKIVQEQKRVEVACLMKKFEKHASALMSIKDEHIRQLMQQIMQLQDLNSTLQFENESLRNTAKQNQATIESLNQTILQLNEVINHPSEDAESCCDEAYLTPCKKPSDTMRVICGRCCSREANMVFLPCRHICACDVCESEMHLCPFCNVQKSSSIITLVFDK